jgi:hypothetical protein
MAPARARTAQTEEPRTEPTAEPPTTNGANGTGREGAERESEGRRTATLTLPFVTLQFRRPDLHLPRFGQREAGEAAGAVAATARSLSPAELAYYAGLGLLAVVELIEWPVALAVGVGTALARSGGDGGRDRRQDTAGSGEARPGGTGPQETTPGAAGGAASGTPAATR